MGNVHPNKKQLHSKLFNISSTKVDVDSTELEVIGNLSNTHAQSYVSELQLLDPSRIFQVQSIIVASCVIMNDMI